MKASATRNVATLSAHEANLKKRLQRHLAELGFRKIRNGALEISGTDKEIIRGLYSARRNDRLRLNKAFFSQTSLYFFAISLPELKSIRLKSAPCFSASAAILGRPTSFGWLR